MSQLVEGAHIAIVLIAIVMAGTWLLIFGGVGSLLSRSNGQPMVLGFGLGALFGPIGWLGVWFLARRGGGTGGPSVRPGTEETDGEDSGRPQSVEPSYGTPETDAEMIEW